MKSESSGSIHSIVEAPIGKRLGAALLDGAIAIFIWLFLAMIVMTPIANAGLGYSSTMTLGYTYQTSSHLYLYQQLDDNGDPEFIEVKDYTEKVDTQKDSQIVSLAKQEALEPSYYLEHIYYYYTSYLTGENVVMPTSTESHTYDMVNDHFVSPDYQSNVNGTDQLPKDYYSTSWFNSNILLIGGDGDAFFETADLNVLASLKGDADKTSAISYLRNLANNASSDLYYRGYYQDLNNTLKWDQVFIVAPAYVLTMCIFYLLIPMLFKNGETLGKKFCHLAVISKDGYAAKKRQILFRFFVFLLEISLSLFITGVGFTSIATLGLGIVILLVATLISKDHRSPHDYAAYTLEIDAQKSVWFASKEEEQRHVDELALKMEKYKSQKVENKNIIQVGSTIIDPKLKKEVEDAQKSKK